MTERILSSEGVSIKLQGNQTCTGLAWPYAIQEFEAPQISRQTIHEGGMVVSPKHKPSLSPKEYLLLSQPQGHSAAGRVISMENF
jgi:hypothetical protein